MYIHAWLWQKQIYPKHASIWENVASVTETMIIVQTNIHHRSKHFTTGQAGVNP